jgi:hypothetical protein
MGAAPGVIHTGRFFVLIPLYVVGKINGEVIAHFVNIGGIGQSLSFYSKNIFFVMHILYSTSSNFIPIIHKYI